VPGLLYHTKVAVIHNESTESQEMNVDLYYSSSFTGKYQYSPDGGTHWISIDTNANSWTKNVLASEMIWLRGWLLKLLCRWLDSRYSRICGSYSTFAMMQAK